ncbi:MAG: DUF4974 domain-containing protein [Chitinophaga sp.]|uniref:FecR family protein n=1 Tax=Chitinophaga sp. TaxID=1869181 RepID=UPI0025C4AB4D|nr:FecR family protein [Chitinophaga sp.]MBV8251434.1 DUF4974 domain-containing protein [Chitinophaga sp.]
MNDERIEEALHIAALIQQLREGKITAEDQEILHAWVAADKENEAIFRQISDPAHWERELQAIEKYDANVLTQRVFTAAGLSQPAASVATNRSIFHLRNYWQLSIAVAVIGIVVIAIRLHMQQPERPAITNKPVASTVAINPGGNKATLVLGNGAIMTLKDSAEDTVALQGGSLIAQQQEGVLVYHKAAATAQNESIWNTVSTPKGGKYEIVLSDGTHIYLNAASSVKFPVSFNNNYREVVLSGEAYFEVTHRMAEKGAWPFLVKIQRAGEDEGEVKVLGTHFNVMAYDDEKTVKTTLVEGSVSMQKGANAVLLKPGQQSVWNPKANKLEVKPADIEAEIAWKNGRFLFRSTDIKTIMRQLSRWYDVSVDYSGDMTDIRFAGNIERKENIRELIEILEADGRLRFSISGSKIIVSRIQNKEEQ